MINMKRMVLFSLSVERTQYRGRYFYIGAWTALGTESLELRGAGCAVRLHLLVERGGGESTRDLQIFRVPYHPGEHFLAGRCVGLAHTSELKLVAPPRKRR